MTTDRDARQAKIDSFIEHNVKQVFSELEQDRMPDQIIDLLTALRAQDEERSRQK